jgi:hypothetical protein
MDLVTLACPHCDYTKDMLNDKLPKIITKVVCPKCKNEFVYKPQINDINDEFAFIDYTESICCDMLWLSISPIAKHYDPYAHGDLTSKINLTDYNFHVTKVNTTLPIYRLEIRKSLKNISDDISNDLTEFVGIINKYIISYISPSAKIAEAIINVISNSLIKDNNSKAEDARSLCNRLGLYYDVNHKGVLYQVDRRFAGGLLIYMSLNNDIPCNYDGNGGYEIIRDSDGSYSTGINTPCLFALKEKRILTDA